MSYYDGQYNSHYPEMHYHPPSGPNPLQYSYSNTYTDPNVYQYTCSDVGGYGYQWDWSQAMQGCQRLPQQNIHLNPAFVHLNPEFFPPPASSLPSSRKVIVNPKFFGINVKQSEAVVEPPKPKEPEPAPQKKTLIVNKKYSWKKIDPASVRVQKTLRPVTHHSVASKSNVRPTSVGKLRRQASLKSGFRSRFKLDKRSPSKARTTLNHKKSLHTKYKIVRNAGTVRHSFGTRSDKFKSKRRVSGKLLAAPRATPVRCKLFARNKWRPLANTSLTLHNKSPLVRERKPGNKSKKKKASDGPAKRYFNTTNLDKQGKLQQSLLEDFEVEAADQPVGLRRREPLGNLPSYITLS